MPSPDRHPQALQGINALTIHQDHSAEAGQSGTEWRVSIRTDDDLRDPLSSEAIAERIKRVHAAMMFPSGTPPRPADCQAA